MIRTIVTLSAGLVLSLNASAVLVDFEDHAVPAVSAASPGSLPFISGGFSFNYSPEPYVSFGNNWQYARNNTTYLMPSGNSQLNTLTMQEATAKPFDLNSLDIAEVNDNFSTNVVVTGYLAAGGTVSKTITLDTQQYYINIHTGFETVSFDSSWNGLSSVSFEGINSRTPTSLYALDNIAVDVVPEPGTIALVGIFGSGLWFVRRYFPSV